MLIQNAVKITENYPNIVYLVSAHRHDYNTYTFKDGSTVSVDGGNSYRRRAYSGKDSYDTNWMEWCIDDTEPLYAIKEKLLWGTFGKSGKEPLKYVLLKNCETSHLEKILEQKNIGALYKKVILSILKDRLPKFNRKEVFAEVDKSNKRMSKKKK